MKKGYEKLKYRFDLLKKGESIFEMGDLANFTQSFKHQDELESSLGLDPEFVMKYIILMYTPKSPAIENFPHLGKRKTWVLSELGVLPNAQSKYEEKYNYLLLNKIHSVVRKISLFLTLQKPTDWAIMLHAQEELHKLLSVGDFDENDTPIEAEDTDVSKSAVKRKLIEETRKQLDAARDRIVEKQSELQKQDLEVFMAQTFLGIRHEEMLMLYDTRPVKPKEVKANMLYPEIDEN